jgi:hypothetical protein
LPSSPALNWALRTFSVRSAVAIGQDESAGAVLTLERTDLPASGLPDQPVSRLNTAYRGQNLIWQTTPGWSGALPSDLFAWLFERNAPENHQSLIVWVRGDLFPGGSAP